MNTDQFDTSPTEAKFYIALLITFHAVICGLLINAFDDSPTMPVILVGALVYSLITSGLVYHYARIAFPKE